jgi:hypothetical protein
MSVACDSRARALIRVADLHDRYLAGEILPQPFIGELIIRNVVFLIKQRIYI